MTLKYYYTFLLHPVYSDIACLLFFFYWRPFYFVNLNWFFLRYTTLFSPELPQEKITAIDKLSIGVADKIILSFERSWWRDNLMGFLFLWKPEDLKEMSNDTWLTKNGGVSMPTASNNTVTIWLSGETAKLVNTYIKRLFLKNYIFLHATNILMYQYLNVINILRNTTNTKTPKNIIIYHHQYINAVNTFVPPPTV